MNDISELIADLSVATDGSPELDERLFRIAAGPNAAILVGSMPTYSSEPSFNVAPCEVENVTFEGSIWHAVVVQKNGEGIEVARGEGTGATEALARRIAELRLLEPKTEEE